MVGKYIDFRDYRTLTLNDVTIRISNKEVFGLEYH